MAQREGKCTNFGLCTMADSRETITLPEGEEFSCPECGKMLAEVEGKGKGAGGGGGGKGSGKAKLALGALAVALLAGGGYFLLVQPTDDETKTDEVKKDEVKKEEPKPKPPDPQPKPPDPGPADSVTPQPKPTPKPIVNPSPHVPDPNAAEIERLRKQQEQLRAEQEKLKEEQARLATLRSEQTKTSPIVDPSPKKTDVSVEPAYSGPSSGTIVWEGTVHSKGELVTIDNGVANKGSVVSGKLPGVAVLLQSDNPKKVAIASPPGPDNRYRRVVLRVQGSGPQKVVLSWSLP